MNIRSPANILCTVNISSPMSSPLTLTTPGNLPTPVSAPVNISHPVNITSPMNLPTPFWKGKMEQTKVVEYELKLRNSETDLLKKQNHSTSNKNLSPQTVPTNDIASSLTKLKAVISETKRHLIMKLMLT
ncbi:Vascular endothelial zinc finger 1, partial [Ophiophagus hannah]